MPDIVFKTSSNEGIIAVVPSPNIQTITKASCPTELTQVKDARDNNSYYIKKLGNDCWMLTNLAYAGGTANGGANTYNDVINPGPGTKGTNTISGPGNSDSYTEELAKYYTPPGANPTIDPTPSSTATDGGANTATRQFGYLYNWCAAMGGQNTAACSGSTTTPTPTPIINTCPSGWRLPATGEFTALNNAINGGRTNIDIGLRSSGLFQLSGDWNGGFSSQGRYGYLWTPTQYSASIAHSIFFDSTGVDPAEYPYKGTGYAVRCIAA